MHILVADDDPLVRRLVEATLRQLGHDVTAVVDGDEALDVLLRPGAPRVAILDWMMPAADGLDVCRMLRQQSTSYVYVIMLTGRDRPEDMIEAMEADVDDFLTKPLDVAELRAHLRTAERIVRLQQRLLEAQDTLWHQAMHDSLTGLWNRAMILSQLSQELNRVQRSGNPVSVLLVDLDHFKAVNDTYGHARGDEVLQHAAKRMSANLRAYDCIGRYGGEEFLVVLPDCDIEGARIVAERIREAVAALDAEGLVPCKVTVSLGLASTEFAPAHQQVLLHAADAALYRAKHAGRDRVAA
jgi:diguanylate cyclase (GGDEF)-like protein